MSGRLLLPIALVCVAAAVAVSVGRGGGAAVDQIAVVTTDGRIALVTPAGTRLAVLMPKPRPLVSSWAPAWSPDGTRLAFARTTDGRRSFHVYVMNADGTGVRQISHGRFDEDPAWSPEGSWIAYASESGIKLVRPDGTGLRNVGGTGVATAHYSEPYATTPAWTRDGRLGYGFHAETPSDWPPACKKAGSRCGWVVTARMDGSGQRRLVRGRDPHWSPDGTTVVYTLPDGGVATVLAAGGKPHPLGRGYLADWSADGGQIIYARLGLTAAGDSIWLMNADGTARHRILQGASMPAWRPAGQP
jgi:Tol biopolymer transport system component